MRRVVRRGDFAPGEQQLSRHHPRRCDSSLTTAAAGERLCLHDGPSVPTLGRVGPPPCGPAAVTDPDPQGNPIASRRGGDESQARRGSANRFVPLSRGVPWSLSLPTADEVCVEPTANPTTIMRGRVLSRAGHLPHLSSDRQDGPPCGARRKVDEEACAVRGVLSGVGVRGP